MRPLRSVPPSRRYASYDHRAQARQCCTSVKFDRLPDLTIHRWLFSATLAVRCTGCKVAISGFTSTSNSSVPIALRSRCAYSLIALRAKRGASSNLPPIALH